MSTCARSRSRRSTARRCSPRRSRGSPSAPGRSASSRRRTAASRTPGSCRDGSTAGRPSLKPAGAPSDHTKVAPGNDVILTASGYRSILEALEEGVFVQDATGAIIAWNAAGVRIHGVCPDEVRDHAVLEPRWTLLREDGSPLPRDERPGRVRLASGRQLRGVVVGVRRPDDEVRWLSTTTALVDLAEHDRAAVVITFTDITDRRREEQQRLRAEE